MRTTFKIIIVSLFVSTTYLNGQLPQSKDNFGVKIEELSFQDFNEVYKDVELINLASPNGVFDDPTAGDELIKYTKHFYYGYGMVMAGYLVAVIGAASYSEEIMLIGGVGALAGGILLLESHSHIGKAGKILNSTNNSSSEKVHIHSTSHGIGLAINIGH
ncbi:MAG: hypothetical protein JXB49_35300 [Bacteroidales bacterium]|nr:hypothetical protein [Bacteroidales bacterium]